MVNIEIRFIIFFAAKMEKLYIVSKNKTRSWLWLGSWTPLLRKVHTVKPMLLLFFYPVVLYECEIWTVKKFDGWRIDVFRLWCWWRLLRIAWTARRVNQGINAEYSLEGLMLKLKLQYFVRMIQRANSLEKTLMLEILRAKGEGSRGWGD